MLKQLPQSTLDYLEYGAQEGERNAEAFKHACQLRDAGCSLSESLDRIVPRAVADGLLASESRRAVESAYQGTQRDPVQNVERKERVQYNKPQPKKKPKQAKKVEPKALPAEIPDGAETLIRTCFQPGDWIAIGDTFVDEDGAHKPGGGVTYEYEVLLKAIKDRGIQKVQGNHDIFIRVNPLIEDGKSNRDVTAFRHVLVEFDRDENGQNIPKELQYAAILESGMPVRVLLDSGNKSIHAWIHVDARNEKEYKERVEIIWDYFSNMHLDTQNRNASRYSRCPGVKRLLSGTGKDAVYGQQKLLAVNLGAESWEDWVESKPAENRFLGAFRGSLFSANQMVNLTVPPKPLIIGEWLAEGDIGFVFAARGVGKTWFGMALAHAIATNTPFGPWKAVNGPRKVLYVDGEVSASDVQKRNNALDIRTEDFVYLNHELLFELEQETMDIADPEQQVAFLELCKQFDFKVVILDNLSCLAPMCDENDGFVWSSQLLNWVLDIRRRGITIIFIQHAGRNGQMRGHSRREDPANWIIRLNEDTSIGATDGARFVSTFKKNRNAATWPLNYAWAFIPNGDKTTIATLTATTYDQFRMHVEEGMTRNDELAEELQVNKGSVSKMAKKGEEDGWMYITKAGKYLPSK